MNTYAYDTTAVWTGGTAYAIPANNPIKASPQKEYVAGGAGLYAPNLKQVLPRGIDDITSDFGASTYDAMMTDPVVSGSIGALIYTVLSDGWSIRPRLATKPGQAPTPEELQSSQVSDFCCRLLDRLPFEDVLCQFLLALIHGNRLAEKVYEVQEYGPDKNLLTLKALKFKPRWAWSFVVDSYRNVLGILAYAPTQGPSVFLPRDKFALFSWQPKDADPRGRSILRPAYGPWNLKTQEWPHFFKYLALFGTPILVGNVAENARPRLATEFDPPSSMAPDGTISPEQDMLNSLVGVQSGTALAIANTAKVTALTPSGNGEAHTKAIELFNREIVQAILLTARATLEAQHASKADSETGQDMLGQFVRFIRRVIAQVVEADIFKESIVINFGAEIADAHTPLFCLGENEHQDSADFLRALAALFASGYFAESQLAALDARYGLPIREPGEQAMKQTDAAAAAARPAPGPGQAPDSIDPTAPETS